MPNKYVETNLRIAKLMDEIFNNANEIEKFIKTTNFSNANIIWGTLGGHFCYTTVWEKFGWKIQQHNISVPPFLSLRSHYRILDHNDKRRAWVMDPDILVKALRDYKDVSKF